MLEIKSVTKDFGGIRAVDSCTFSVEENTITALIGPTGAGKTTLFNIITGFYPPDEGNILLKGDSITGFKPYKIARAGLSRTFQLTRLFPKLTVMENLLLGRKQEGENFFKALFYYKKIKEEAKEYENELIEYLKIVGLENKKNELAGKLSYGQQKLVEIARALATEADILLLDEPTAGVNPAIRQELRKVLLELKKRGKTILFIEHDMPFVVELAEQVVVMDAGREIATGKPEQIQKDKKVLDAYLGRAKGEK